MTSLVYQPTKLVAHSFLFFLSHKKSSFSFLFFPFGFCYEDDVNGWISWLLAFDMARLATIVSQCRFKIASSTSWLCLFYLFWAFFFPLLLNYFLPLLRYSVLVVLAALRGHMKKKEKIKTPWKPHLRLRCVAPRYLRRCVTVTNPFIMEAGCAHRRFKRGRTRFGCVCMHG